MKLLTYLIENNLTNAEFGRRIGTSAEAVRRYCDGSRVPRPAIMKRISEETNGRVAANDFY